MFYYKGKKLNPKNKSGKRISKPEKLYFCLMKKQGDTFFYFSIFYSGYARPYNNLTLDLILYIHGIYMVRTLRITGHESCQQPAAYKRYHIFGGLSPSFSAKLLNTSGKKIKTSPHPAIHKHIKINK